MKLSMIFMISILVIVQWPDAMGECCTGMQSFTSKICDTFCCGCGACNLFCCNCADGCNWAYGQYWRVKIHCDHKKKRYTDSYYVRSNAQQLFNEVDTDGSQNITIDEADKYLKNRRQDKRDTTFSLKDQIEEMDENMDGVISPFEFDSSLRF